NNQVSLDYGVRRGPRTTLAVEGYSLPNRLTNQMRTAWTQAVFDGFLLEDLENGARRELIRNGHLQADVTVAIEVSPDGETKVVQVTIVPGARSTSRALAFEGNRQVSDSTL